MSQNHKIRKNAVYAQCTIWQLLEKIEILKFWEGHKHFKKTTHLTFDIVGFPSNLAKKSLTKHKHTNCRRGHIQRWWFFKIFVNLSEYMNFKNKIERSAQLGKKKISRNIIYYLGIFTQWASWMSKVSDTFVPHCLKF